MTWDAPDPITKIVEVYGSQYDDRVAVAYTTRRMGKELTDIVGFDLQKEVRHDPQLDPDHPTGPTVTPPTVTPPEDPKLTKAVAAARKLTKAKALAGWQAVISIDPQHAEALYQIAVLQAGAKKPAEAQASISALAASTRPDAIEWLIEARFDKAFATLRADPQFRAKIGLDKKGGSAYERLMGFGGQWEQTGTSCDTPEVRFTATRDRVVRIRVKSRCSGQVYDLPFKGAWRSDGDRVVLTFATKGKAVTAADEAVCKFEAQGDEDSLHCNLGNDIEFVVLPTRRGSGASGGANPGTRNQNPGRRLSISAAFPASLVDLPSMLDGGNNDASSTCGADGCQSGRRTARPNAGRTRTRRRA
ncbi:MAG: hypothetical protein IPQ07_06420 [Myxococcales bacterium]|nr:hypothetical protein [Myxococcales bacterium]